MIYGLRHRTTYAYGNSVSFARCVLRLIPNSSPGQTVLKTALTVTPEPSVREERIGPFGETVVTVIIDKPHTSLVIEANSRVDVHAPPLPNASASLQWEVVRGAAFSSSGLEANGPAAFLYPTRRTPKLAMITDYARQSFPPGRPIVEATSELMRRIHADFKYDPGATEVSTPVLEAFNARHGVCQDFSHIMITGLRGLGLPTSYISGYLRTIPPPGQQRLEGADATHAWVTVWCGEGVGWIGFDPTNAILAQNDHIELGVGRDYSDVAPIDGIILASGKQDLTVEVDVIPEGED
ncbi:transglutaminase family protein [Phenylobacterium sp.]|uniref:transglutaminase family protein n=1 Tax=Phenylobacterium sp. TaxID=1871053 RepID=UPI0025F78D75|nr:transglutaminase family protein [Phenylobacterium sp.]